MHFVIAMNILLIWPVQTQVYCEDHLSLGLSKCVLPLGR
jgi:hypothetical protein